ncbi:phosphoadenylyl-sulfate reductase [Methylobrevis pamukkalensis]|uniref:Adenosine 5'-phosphosulfate reductase n=1 Tax=Methylobrevis pamukkalensis TaxID=1439726 RepID=A0A1E3GYC6_9HYPH|nr:phosphoadenylyl-sulfate reductase [Methylobrevis pamukkalensis]ODN69067.1 Phosphoadenosine phosphosulfate reductase [Methylobrevis pamukkalensis]
MALDALKLDVDPDEAAEARARDLSARYANATAEQAIDAALNDIFPGEIALVSSFGAESAVLLKLVADIDRHVPVVFLDTGKLFGETLRYRDKLVDLFGLTDVRSIKPVPARLAEVDPDGGLWLRDNDTCCHIRKVEPLTFAMEGFSAWFTGRKRFQAETRSKLQLFEAEGTRIKVNPLAGWSSAEIKAFRAKHDLPAHPLVAEGFLSIGCMPCTDRVAEGEDERAGRWRGAAKTECGIHLGLVGRELDGSGI